MGESKYGRFDAADYLEGLDDVATYLEIALQESAEDPSAVPRALGVIAPGEPAQYGFRLGGAEPQRGCVPAAYHLQHAGYRTVWSYC